MRSFVFAAGLFCFQHTKNVKWITVIADVIVDIVVTLVIVLYCY